MKFRYVTLCLALALLAAGILAPFVNANRFRGQIQAGLERALNRRVTIEPEGEVHLTLFAGPGFTVTNVLIGEGPGMGIEPFAYVESLEARVGLGSLFTGHLAFSHLRLVDPSVNFVKRESGEWNVQPLLTRVQLPTEGPHAAMPEIEISEGRLNFKFGDTESVFYINNADLDVYTDEQGDLVVRFSGEPSRTDHVAQGLGRLVARGVVRARQNSEDELAMSLQLERTPIPELTRLLDVRDIGVRGFVASNLKLDGPLSKVKLSGELRIEDIHRWDLMPNKGEGWTLNYAGFLNIPGQQVQIETRGSDGQTEPVNGRFAASNYLKDPKWEAALEFKELPAAALLDTARHMGAAFPAGAKIDGKLDGEIRYARPEGLTGQLALSDASFQFPQGGVTQFASAPVQIRNNEVEIGPAEIQFEQDQSASLDADYSFDTRALRLGLKTKALNVDRTKDFVGRLLGAGSVPFLERCRQGTWKGSLKFERLEDGPQTWAGDFDVANALVDADGFSTPLRLTTASVQLAADELVVNRIRGRLGTVPVEGEYRHFMGPGRADRVRLMAGELQWSDVESLLTPALTRQQGFFERALRLERGRIPEWLLVRNLEGTFQVKNLLAGDVALGTVRGHVLWTGAKLKITDLQSKWNEMEGSGTLLVDLGGLTPQYRLTGEMRGIAYREGTLDVVGVLDASGMGTDLALNARSDGTFDGSGISLDPDVAVDEITGEYHAEAGVGGVKVGLTKVQVVQGQEVLRGQGGSQADGRVVLELMSAGKKVRMTGMLLGGR